MAEVACNAGWAGNLELLAICRDLDVRGWVHSSEGALHVLNPGDAAGFFALRYDVKQEHWEAYSNPVEAQLVEHFEAIGEPAFVYSDHLWRGGGALSDCAAHDTPLSLLVLRRVLLAAILLLLAALMLVLIDGCRCRSVLLTVLLSVILVATFMAVPIIVLMVMLFLLVHIGGRLCQSVPLIVLRITLLTPSPLMLIGGCLFRSVPLMVHLAARVIVVMVLVMLMIRSGVLSRRACTPTFPTLSSTRSCWLISLPWPCAS